MYKRLTLIILLFLEGGLFFASVVIDFIRDRQPDFSLFWADSITFGLFLFGLGFILLIWPDVFLSRAYLNNYLLGTYISQGWKNLSTWNKLRALFSIAILFLFGVLVIQDGFLRIVKMIGF